MNHSNAPLIDGKDKKMSKIKSVMVMVAATAIALVGCDPSGGGGGGDTTANLTFKAIMDSSGAPNCTANSVDNYEPVRMTGSAGSVDPIVHSKTEKVFASAGQCIFQDLVLGLRLGDWRVSNSWAGSCSVTLHGGSNVVSLQNFQCTSL